MGRIDAIAPCGELIRKVGPRFVRPEARSLGDELSPHHNNYIQLDSGSGDRPAFVVERAPREAFV